MIKWYQSDKPLHPLSAGWGACEKEQSLNFVPQSGNFVKCMIEVPDTESDKLYQIIILINLNGEEPEEDLPGTDQQLVEMQTLLPF